MTMFLSTSAKVRACQLLRAMLCNITWNFRAIWIHEIGNRSVLVQFLLEKDINEDREAIDDILFEFEAQEDGWIDLQVQVDVSTAPLSDFETIGYLLYARHEE
jgi:hypothetical protein